MMPDPDTKQTHTHTQQLTKLYAVRPEWMLGLGAFSASLHHRSRVRTCPAKSANLHLIEQPH